MATHSDYQQGLLDQASGLEMDLRSVGLRLAAAQQRLAIVSMALQRMVDMHGCGAGCGKCDSPACVAARSVLSGRSAPDAGGENV